MRISDWSSDVCSSDLVTWVLDDWRLLTDASISGDFGSMMDTGMAGRIGNTVTINGRLPDTFPVRAGERLRLRLINAANARIFGLEFEGHQPQIIALDRSEEHTSELQSLMRISSAVFCLKKNKT